MCAIGNVFLVVLDRFKTVYLFIRVAKYTYFHSVFVHTADNLLRIYVYEPIYP